MMLCCTCYMTAMLLVGRRCRRRIGAPIAVSRASASSCAHNTLIVTGTLSSTTCGASAANQHIHDFGGSMEGSPGWYPADFRFYETCMAMMDWPHTYPDWCVVLLTCSTKAVFVGGRYMYSKVRDD